MKRRSLAYSDFLDFANASLGVGVDEVGGCPSVLPQQLHGRAAFAESAASSGCEALSPRSLDEEEAVEPIRNVSAVELMQPRERTELPENGLYRELLVWEEHDVVVLR